MDGGCGYRAALLRQWQRRSRVAPTPARSIRAHIFCTCWRHRRPCCGTLVGRGHRILSAAACRHESKSLGCVVMAKCGLGLLVRVRVIVVGLPSDGYRARARGRVRVRVGVRVRGRVRVRAAAARPALRPHPPRRAGRRTVRGMPASLGRRSAPRPRPPRSRAATPPTGRHDGPPAG